MYPIKIITVEKSRFLENKANEAGLSFAEMMENAGFGVAEAIRHRLGAKGRRILVLVGPGNNGGDGLVAAHYLWEMGAQVTCYIWKRSVEDDANLERIEGDHLSIVWAADDTEFRALRGLLSDAHVVVDALLGVGVSLPIRKSLRQLLEVVRGSLAERRGPRQLTEVVPRVPVGSGPTVLAVDCPTGLDCDTGELDPAALHADTTVTFAYPKVGLLRFPGAEAVGDLVVVDIAIPPELADDVSLVMATAEQIQSWLPGRPDSAHKGTFGRALIVAGSANYVGAAALAGMSATRVGAGLVTMALPTPIQPSVAANLVEATYLLLPHDMGVIASGAVKVLQANMGEYGVLLLGPGLTQEKETVAFVHTFLGLERAERKGRLGFVSSSGEEEAVHLALPSLIVDADGLNALVKADSWWKALPPDTILTPHPGEMARLMGDEGTVKEIEADREGVARRMAAKWGVVVVLKGAFTVVAAPDGRVSVLPFANAGLATAGSGDVLAGAIVGLRAQGLEAFEAAVAGAYLHGLAGELARAELGDMGMVAGDLPPRLPLALRRIRWAYPLSSEGGDKMEEEDSE
ncbi:MAG: NAD(P)H-hydrate dehydratase [Anaerolineae bacterium]|jgi:NAD(P)H-hydrate epimerase